MPLALLAAVTLAACAEPEADSNVVDAYSLQLGQCTGEIPAGGADRLTLLDCAGEHSWEAFAQTEATGAKFPGNAELTKDAGEFCEAAFEEFTGVKVSKSKYALTYLEPTEETWAAGDRAITCLAGKASGGVVGSLESVGE
ncbi:MAG: septum formation family protein [Propionibacteriaceae bacterium]|nr:septum formation family protein [Propionibacteriaceae bacterium]